MVSGAGHPSFRERADPRSKLYWLDIDVTFNDIMRQQRMAPRNPHIRLPQVSAATLHSARRRGGRQRAFRRRPGEDF
jgi:hypothetical protein